MMRRSLLVLIPALLLAACGGAGNEKSGNTLSIAATAVPHAEILEHVKPALLKQGITLEIRVFNDYVQPNKQVQQGQIDVNYFQTRPFLDDFNRANHADLVPVAAVHIEPLGAYSRKWKDLKQIPDGATVAIPNDASNGGRALLLLAKARLVTLKNPADPLASTRDVVGNPLHLVFREIEAATLPRTLGEVDLALINTNYALDAGLNPVRDALVIEDRHSPYVNLIVGKPGSENDPRVRKLVAALHSEDVKRFIARSYKDAVLPAF